MSIRKDIDHNMFDFPKPYSLEKRLEDFLEPHVDEKYFLSDDLISKVVSWKAHQKPFEKVLGNKSISPTLTARGAGENHSGMILYSDTLEDTSNLQNDCLQIREKTKKGYTEAQDGDGVYINRPEQKRGVVQKGMIQTIKTSPDIGVVVNAEIKPKLVGGIGDKISNGLRIRKLSPLECWRLMGFSDEDFEKAKAVPTSNTQLYKQAGNSIVVDVLEEIFCMMLDDENNLLV